MPQIYDMGQTALLPFRRKACWGFFRPKNPTASAGFELQTWVLKASTLPLDHRSRYHWLYINKKNIIPCYSLYHAVNTSTAHGSQIVKTHHQTFSNQHNNDIIQAGSQHSHKSASIPTVQNKHILEEFHATFTNQWSLTWNCSGTLLHKTLHFTNTSLHSQIKQNSLTMKSNSENGSQKWYRQVLKCITEWQHAPSVLKTFGTYRLPTNHRLE